MKYEELLGERIIRFDGKQGILKNYIDRCLAGSEWQQISDFYIELDDGTEDEIPIDPFVISEEYRFMNPEYQKWIDMEIREKKEEQQSIIDRYCTDSRSEACYYIIRENDKEESEPLYYIKSHSFREACAVFGIVEEKEWKKLCHTGKCPAIRLCKSCTDEIIAHTASWAL